MPDPADPHADRTSRMGELYRPHLDTLRTSFGAECVEMSSTRVIYVRWPDFGLEFAGPNGRPLPPSTYGGPWSVLLYDEEGTTIEHGNDHPRLDAAITAGFDLIDRHEFDTALAHAEDLRELSESPDR